LNYFNNTSKSLQSQLQTHFKVNFKLTSNLLQTHFKLTSSSLQAHFKLTSNYWQPYHLAYSKIIITALDFTNSIICENMLLTFSIHRSKKPPASQAPKALTKSVVHYSFGLLNCRK